MMGARLTPLLVVNGRLNLSLMTFSTIVEPFMMVFEAEANPGTLDVGSLGGEPWGGAASPPFGGKLVFMVDGGIGIKAYVKEPRYAEMLHAETVFFLK